MKLTESTEKSYANPTINNCSHIVYVLQKAAVPLIEDNTADTTQTQQKSSLQGFLQSKLSWTGAEIQHDYTY